MTLLFDRKLELTIDDRVWNYPDLHIEFGVPFTYVDEPNVSEIKVYNLNDNSINSIKKGMPCTLNAGYSDDLATILAGVIYEVHTSNKKSDTITTIKVVDVQSQYLNTNISKTYRGAINAKFILNDMFSLIGMKVNIIKLGKNFIYQKGFTASGKTIDVAKRIVKDCGSKLIINNNVINIVSDTAGLESGYLLSAETGLISIEPTENSRTNANYKIQSLLLNKLAARSYIEIKSKTFSGIAMVVQGKHDNFITNCEVMTIG